MLKFFVTGTDTGVGKTYITKLLLEQFSKSGFSTLGIKPVASGCYYQQGKLVNEDALILQQASSIKLPYEQINPFPLEPSIAPHIAAEQSQIKLSTQSLFDRCQTAFHHSADIHLIEGAGGWFVPLNPTETLADFVKLLGIPVILVVGIRLGCINHTLLTAHALTQNNIPFAGWVANCIDSTMRYTDENIAFLKNRLDAPCLGVVPYQESETVITLDVSCLLDFANDVKPNFVS
jgi:dethiobiotin synthetase